MQKPRPVFLLTDFGPGSYYQGVMRAVIASISPDTPVHDLAHGISQGDLREAAFVVQAAFDYLPDTSVLVVVVDPGVGTERRILACTAGWRTVIAPDNGLLTDFLGRSDLDQVRAVTNESIRAGEPSATFHGRDIFAPAAAHVSMGMLEADLGPTVSDPVRFAAAPAPPPSEPGLEATVVHVDPFGNLVTDLSRETWISEIGSPSFSIEFASVKLNRLSQTFADVRPGEPVAYIGSTGHLEVAIRDGNAARSYDLGTGDKVVIRRR